MAVDVDSPDRELIALDDNGSGDPEPCDHPVDASPRANRPHRVDVRLAVAVSLTAVVALASIVGWLGWQSYQSYSVNQKRQAYVEAARQAALNLTTIDHAKVDADVQRILDTTTGAFHDEFQQRSQSLVDAVKQAQSKTEGTVTAAGLESVGANDAQALVTVSVKTVLAGAEEPQPRGWRMRITVQDINNEVKVSNVAFVP
jgi:Mce-associated membrane protein